MEQDGGERGMNRSKKIHESSLVVNHISILGAVESMTWPDFGWCPVFIPHIVTSWENMLDAWTSRFHTYEWRPYSTILSLHHLKGSPYQTSHGAQHLRMLPTSHYLYHIQCVIPDPRNSCTLSPILQSQKRRQGGEIQWLSIRGRKQVLLNCLCIIHNSLKRSLKLELVCSIPLVLVRWTMTDI